MPAITKLTAVASTETTRLLHTLRRRAVSVRDVPPQRLQFVLDHDLTELRGEHLAARSPETQTQMIRTIFEAWLPDITDCGAPGSIS